MINSRKVDDLHPTLKRVCNRFVSDCKDQGIDVMITQTLRDSEYQELLYSYGRTAKNPDGGGIITNARGGSSYHNYGLAFDFAPVENGKINWNDNNPLWKKCGLIGKMLGLEWGGEWSSIKDFPHFQFTNGLSIAQLKSGAKMPDVKMKWEGVAKTETTTIPALPYLLKFGARNDYVKKAQEQLNKNGFKLVPDGIFGNKTLDATKTFQKNRNLVVDGIIGNKTWLELNK